MAQFPFITPIQSPMNDNYCNTQCTDSCFDCTSQGSQEFDLLLSPQSNIEDPDISFAATQNPSLPISVDSYNLINSLVDTMEYAYIQPTFGPNALPFEYCINIEKTSLHEPKPFVCSPSPLIGSLDNELHNVVQTSYLDSQSNLVVGSPRNAYKAKASSRPPHKYTPTMKGSAYKDPFRNYNHNGEGFVLVMSKKKNYKIFNCEHCSYSSRKKFNRDRHMELQHSPENILSDL
ncbi:hypothetical protein CLU79DRAFT_769987 [Phycomyces nitens]|nr:hypothetical protein CLU79DRAFT_769987 [Phycomyces nitens]